MSKIIGIDLGTTNSCVCVLEGINAAGKPEVAVIPNAEGARTTPSVIAFTADGKRLVGQLARRQANTNPTRTISAVKRLMGRKFAEAETQDMIKTCPYEIVAGSSGDAWVQIDDEVKSPPELSSTVLLAMKEIAETYLGESVNEAIITVPAYFDDAQRQATKDAGKIAGLDVKRIINEPTAAALAYGLESGEDRCVAVYDLGGGTFDISVLDIVDGVFSVKATGGDTHLGGEDFDTRVIKLLAEEFEAKYSVNLLSDSSSLQRLREAAERAKHELSSSLETEVNIPFIATNASGPLHLERSLKRSELDILCRDLVTRTLEACKMTIADGNVELSEIDEVVLVGGMTRMPAVQSAVAEFFAKAPAKSVNPDEVVALGAALQGAALSGAIEEVLLLDVTPLSIGVETGGGVFTRLIPRNTTIPTERSEVFTTSVDNQTFVPIHVLQGEREMAQDNRSLAHFELTGIPPAPRGLPKIQVAFSIDAEGLLSVEAVDLGTSRSQNISVKASSGLSQEEVDKLVQQGELFHQADILRRDLAELKNKAETLVYQTEQAVEAYADFVPPELIAVVQEDTNHLRGLMAGGSDLESLRGAHAQLENSAFELAEALYGDDAETPTIDESPENQTDEQTLENS